MRNLLHGRVTLGDTKGRPEEGFVTEVDGRRSRRFSWTEVDELLVRKLVKAFYMSRELPNEASKVARLGPTHLRLEAARILGRPPKAGYRLELTHVLLDSWVPKASPEVLVGLTDLVRLALGAEERRKVSRRRSSAWSFFEPGTRPRTSSRTFGTPSFLLTSRL